MKENNELTRDDIAIDHDMEVDCDEGREITVYIEAWFDVDKKFHIETASDDDTWLNMYGRYNPFDDSLRIECEISRQDGSTYFDYEPTKDEAQLIKDMIAEKIRRTTIKPRRSSARITTPKIRRLEEYYDALYLSAEPQGLGKHVAMEPAGFRNYGRCRPALHSDPCGAASDASRSRHTLLWVSYDPHG